MAFCTKLSRKNAEARNQLASYFTTNTCIFGDKQCTRTKKSSLKKNSFGNLRSNKTIKVSNYVALKMTFKSQCLARSCMKF